jgi:hypothetical protein
VKDIIINLLITKVAEYFRMTRHQLLSNNKNRGDEYKIPRYIVWYFLKKHTNLSLSDMGKLFNKDHATVLSGLKTLNNLIETDLNYKGYIDDLSNDAKLMLEKQFTPRSIKRKHNLDEICLLIELKYDIDTSNDFREWYKQHCNIDLK